MSNKKARIYMIHYTITTTVEVCSTDEETAIMEGEEVAVQRIADGDGVHVEPEIIRAR